MSVAAIIVACVNNGGGRQPRPMGSAAEGYAERQIRNTLSMVEPIDVNINSGYRGRTNFHLK